MSKKTEKAERCERLLNDPEFEAAFGAVRQSFIKKILDTSVKDTTGIMDCKKCIHLLDKVKQELENAVRAGKMEKAQAEQPPFLGSVNG